MSPAYSEDNPNHVINPLYQSAFVDTTGTSGTGDIKDISPVFDEHRALAFQQAEQAIDDPDVNENLHVVFHDGEDGQPSREESIQKVRDAAAEGREQGIDINDEPDEESPEGKQEQDSIDSQDIADHGSEPQLTNQETEPKTPLSSNPDPALSDSNDPAPEPEDDDLPEDTASKAKWVEYSREKNLVVDTSLAKPEFIAAVKQAQGRKQVFS